VVEHTDFFLRAKLYGMTVGYTPSVVVKHKRQGGSKLYRRNRYAVKKHKTLMLRKWGFDALKYDARPKGGSEFDPTDLDTHKYRGIEHENYVDQ